MVEKVEGFYEKIVGDTGTLRNLLSKIPGLSGYMERGRRREADQLLRDTITGRLEQVRLNYSTAFQAVSRDIFLAMDYAEQMGRADNLLMGRRTAGRVLRVVPLGQVEALAERLREFSMKPNSLEDRDRQRAWVSSRFSWNDIATRTLEVYKSVLR